MKQTRRTFTGVTKVASTFAGEGTVAFAYGGDQKRREKAVTGGSTTTYRWDQGWNVVEATEGGTAEAYVRDAGGALLAGKAGAVWTYALRDHQGSTRALYDGSKTAAGSLEYTPYGESYAASGTSPRFRYTGKEWDATAKLYYFPYRYYSPERVRWLTRDPLGMVDGPNVYAYVMGNPVNRVDRLGSLSDQVIENAIWTAGFCVLAAILSIVNRAWPGFMTSNDSVSAGIRNCIGCVQLAVMLTLPAMLATIAFDEVAVVALAVAGISLLAIACTVQCAAVEALTSIAGMLTFQASAMTCAMRVRSLRRAMC